MARLVKGLLDPFTSWRWGKGTSGPHPLPHKTLIWKLQSPGLGSKGLGFLSKPYMTKGIASSSCANQCNGVPSSINRLFLGIRASGGSCKFGDLYSSPLHHPCAESPPFFCSITHTPLTHDPVANSLCCCHPLSWEPHSSDLVVQMRAGLELLAGEAEGSRR